MIQILMTLLMMQASAADSYSTVLTNLKRIAAAHPATVQWVEIGLSDSGQQISGLKIGDGPIADLIVAAHHGNEYGSTAVAMGAADSLANDPIAGHTVYIIPVLNISGYNSNNRYETVGNSTLDPNRDYPGPCATEGPFHSKATRALANFIDQKNIVASATLHTYSPAVLYPWGLSTKDLSTPYGSTFINLAKASTVESGYAVGNSTEMLYAADGAFEDYAFWKHGIWSLLYEMGRTHSPNDDQMKQMVLVNVPGLRRFLENAPKERAPDHAFKGKCDVSVQKRTALE